LIIAAISQAEKIPEMAALSAVGLKAVALPPIVRECIALADHDANGRGEHAARAAGHRLVREGRRVRIAMPPNPGTDFNDVLISRAESEARDVTA
jgi:putative DNA primase/helicase